MSARNAYDRMTDDEHGRDLKRSFARADVRRAWELQGRICKLCRRALPVDLMHGDHIAPWARGGLTITENLQALCGSCNLRKGTRRQEIVQQSFDAAKLAAARTPLRRWQSEAMGIVLDLIGKTPVLVEACPGAGKTAFGLSVAHALLQSGAVSRVLIFAPSLGIVDGWLHSASATNPTSPTLPLHGPRDWRPVAPIRDDWVGAVSTYQSLYAMADMFLAHATDPGHRTLVIFDEVHHVGAESAWGTAAQGAFANAAAAVLSLSGTPFRTDRSRIAFVHSEGGSAKPHYRYSYRDAIVDGACRPVQFVEVRGRTRFRTEDGQEHDVSFDDADAADAIIQGRLRAALEWIGPDSIADKMLRDANSYIVALRSSGDPDAAGLVVCVDCRHADRIASHMSRHILRERPVVACSRLFDAEDPAPADAIARFGRGHTPWIIAVNMISEGIDIRRLRVVVYLTNRLTILSFRQIVGRVVRADVTNPVDLGRVYVTGDPRLLEMAQAITDEVDLLPAPIRIETDAGSPQRGTVQAGERHRNDIEVLGTLGEQGGVFDTSGNTADPTLVARARRFIRLHQLNGTDAESLAILARHKPSLLAQIMEDGEEDG